MAAFDFKSLVDTMTSAAGDSLKEKWPVVKDLATTSIQTLASNVLHIKEMQVTGGITPEQANLLFGMQKNALKTVLLAEEGIGLLAAEGAINAVMDSIRGIVNASLGFALV